MSFRRRNSDDSDSYDESGSEACANPNYDGRVEMELDRIREAENVILDEVKEMIQKEGGPTAEGQDYARQLFVTAFNRIKRTGPSPSSRENIRAMAHAAVGCVRIKLDEDEREAEKMRKAIDATRSVRTGLPFGWANTEESIKAEEEYDARQRKEAQQYPAILPAVVNACYICFDGESCWAPTTCGHIACKSCIDKYIQKPCPKCSKPITSAMQIFF